MSCTHNEMLLEKYYEEFLEEGYSEEEAEQKHSLGNKETILVGNEVVRQMKEKERIEKAMNDFSDKMHMEVEPVPSHWIAQVKFNEQIVDLINNYIDETADDGYSYADRLVGQLKNDAESLGDLIVERLLAAK